MSFAQLDKRIARGEIILLDGGIGTEIEKRGVNMDETTWCGASHMTHPDVVRTVHEDYIKNGADIITANTFSSAPHVLVNTDFKNSVREVNELAVKLALEAREAVAERSVCIAGSMSSVPPLNQTKLPVDKVAKASYEAQAHYLAEAGVDMIIAEMMMDLDNAAIVVEAASSTGLPVWVGFSAQISSAGEITNYCDLDKYQMSFDEYYLPCIPFGRMVSEIMSIGGCAAGVMHSLVNHTGPALAELVKSWDGPVYAYAESGHLESPSWKFTDTISPENYVVNAKQWLAIGAQMIGGCCGIGPEHIKALKEGLPEKVN